MPKKVNILDLPLTVERPTVDITKHNCKCNAPTLERCTCSKYFYIVGDRARREMYRVSSNIIPLREAREAAMEWQQKLNAKQRALDRHHSALVSRTAATPAQVFDAYIQMLESAPGYAEEVRIKGKSSSVSKMKTLRRMLCGHEEAESKKGKKYGPGFIAQWNALPLAQKKIEVNQTIACLAAMETITPYWMQFAFRPTWFTEVGGGSAHSIQKRKDSLAAVWHYGYRTGMLPVPKRADGSLVPVMGKHCGCPVCAGIQIPKKMTKTIKPTPPLEHWRYLLALEACGRYQESQRDPNPMQLRATNERLRGYLEIMANCGPRRIDVAWMRWDALRKHKDGSVEWTYVPIKNGDEGAPIVIPFPRHLYDRMMQWERMPQFFHPDYIFTSGPVDDALSVSGGVTLRDAPDPWARAIKNLVELMPAEARVSRDKRNKVKRITPHQFRDTFAVECYVQGMSDRQIAEAVDDDEETIKRSYSPYHDRERVRDAVPNMKEGVRFVQEALAGLNADAEMRAAGVAF